MRVPDENNRRARYRSFIDRKLIVFVAIPVAAMILLSGCGVLFLGGFFGTLGHEYVKINGHLPYPEQINEKLEEEHNRPKKDPTVLAKNYYFYVPDGLTSDVGLEYGLYYSDGNGAYYLLKDDGWYSVKLNSNQRLELSMENGYQDISIIKNSQGRDFNYPIDVFNPDSIVR